MYIENYWFSLAHIYFSSHLVHDLNRAYNALFQNLLFPIAFSTIHWQGGLGVIINPCKKCFEKAKALKVTTFPSKVKFLTFHGFETG